MKRLFARLTLGLSLIWLGAPMILRAQDEVAANGIVFLRVRFSEGGALELLEAQTRPGKLKAGAADVHDYTLRCQVVSPAGVALWTGEVTDPSIQRVEWEDPAQPGHLLSKTIERPQSEFMVRVPLYAKTQRVEFRRAAAAATANRNSTSGKLVGSFDLRLP